MTPARAAAAVPAVVRRLADHGGGTLTVDVADRTAYLRQRAGEHFAVELAFALSAARARFSRTPRYNVFVLLGPDGAQGKAVLCRDADSTPAVQAYRAGLALLGRPTGPGPALPETVLARGVAGLTRWGHVGLPLAVTLTELEQNGAVVVSARASSPRHVLVGVARAPGVMDALGALYRARPRAFALAADTSPSSALLSYAPGVE